MAIKAYEGTYVHVANSKVGRTYCVKPSRTRENIKNKEKWEHIVRLFKEICRTDPFPQKYEDLPNCGTLDEINIWALKVDRQISAELSKEE